MSHALLSGDLAIIPEPLFAPGRVAGYLRSQPSRPEGLENNFGSDLRPLEGWKIIWRQSLRQGKRHSINDAESGVLSRLLAVSDPLPVIFARCLDHCLPRLLQPLGTQLSREALKRVSQLGRGSPK